jgi:predicted nucleic acid-binding protein
MAKRFMADAEILIGDNEYQIGSEGVLDLANGTGCTAYDCEFAALAQQLSVPLVTCDNKLLKAFPRLAISMEEFGA